MTIWRKNRYFLSLSIFAERCSKAGENSNVGREVIQVGERVIQSWEKSNVGRDVIQVGEKVITAL